ncbi:hypothetical protein, partial [Nostocoides australiense]|nr:hypothetical protein [Tetrasphaera australiensis]HRW01058.1 hypothetical protein [Tetrasphaera sp.]
MRSEPAGNVLGQVAVGCRRGHTAVIGDLGHPGSAVGATVRATITGRAVARGAVARGAVTGRTVARGAVTGRTVTSRAVAGRAVTSAAVGTVVRAAVA